MWGRMLPLFTMEILMEMNDANYPGELYVFEAEYLPNQVLHIVVNGLPAVITPEFEHLHQGIAILRDTVDAEFPWVNNLVYHREGDDPRVQSKNKIVRGTGDPIIACLAIRYEQALRTGTVEAGPLPLPSFEEAEREIEAYDCGVVIEPEATFRRS
jgi:hypothetical protein